MSDNYKINNLVYLRDGSVLMADMSGQIYAVNGTNARRLHIQRRDGFTAARFGDEFRMNGNLLLFVYQPKEAE